MLTRYFRTLLAGGLSAAAVAAPAVSLDAQGEKISDPTSVVMIVNRDSNDIGEAHQLAVSRDLKTIYVADSLLAHVLKIEAD